VKKKKSRPARPSRARAPQGPLPELIDWKALQKTAAFLEKAKLADYMEMMNHPLRSMWLNFIAGLARGVGIVLGGSLVGVLLLVAIITGLKAALEHAGGMPFIGEYIKDGIGWILDVVHHYDPGQA
jgi:hypothetical protein